jgi:hypothetical protein
LFSERSIMSLMDFGPVDGFATRTRATSISLATGASSRNRSGPGLLGKLGLSSSAPVAPTPSVSPSGADFASICRPSTPPAPARCSTTT